LAESIGLIADSAPRIAGARACGFGIACTATDHTKIFSHVTVRVV
jgi:hypothetical protein